MLRYGCYVQVAKDDLEKISEIDFCVGINEKNNIVELIEDYFSKNKNMILMMFLKIKNFQILEVLHIQKKQEQLLKFKMDVIDFVHIVLFHMQEEELEVENQKVF